MKRNLWIAGAALLAVLITAVVFIVHHARQSEEVMRQVIIQALGERFRSEVELRAFHVRVFPHIQGYGEDLVLRHHGRTDVPPLIHISRLSFSISLFGLLRPAKHIHLVRLEKMVISVPPRQHGERRQEAAVAPQRDSKMKSIAPVVVDKIICDDTDIIILPKQANKTPLDWDIHNLVLYSVSQSKGSPFHGELTNAKPEGDIETHGEFGPWDAEDPGGTPVSGDYNFTNANLDPFPGIGGTLSSAGKYSGVLSEIDVTGETDTPNFSLDKVGKPLPLHTEFSATVDGTNGDTILHSVTGTLVETVIFSSGRVVGVPGNGHLVNIDATIPQGRIQDILSLTINSDKPLMTGPVKIEVKIIVPPGKVKALEKLILDGQFGVDVARWNSTELRDKLKSLSAKAQGKPEDVDVGSAITDLKGSFHLEKGIINFRHLTFSVQGARMDLAGTYSVVGGELDMKGHLRLEAKLSNTMTGAKSFFLKVFDPFFSKNGAGTELPVTITGTREKPVFGVSVFHKTIKKPMSASPSGGGKID
jgi:hypothetical protein